MRHRTALTRMKRIRYTLKRRFKRAGVLVARLFVRPPERRSMAFKRSGVRLPYAPPRPQLKLRFFSYSHELTKQEGVEPGPGVNDSPVGCQSRADRAPTRRERRLPYAPPKTLDFIRKIKGFLFSVVHKNHWKSPKIESRNVQNNVQDSPPEKDADFDTGIGAFLCPKRFAAQGFFYRS